MQDGKENFVVSQEDWTLHRKGYQDQERHTEKVKEAIRNNLPDLVSEENIILSKGKDVIRIPVRSLDEYKIRYNHDAAKHVGQGDGDSAVGDVIARDGRKAKGTGTGEEAGESPGVDYYEAEVSLAELEELLFSELELPNLQEKEQAEIVIEDIAFHDIRKKGLMGNLDKKRTLLAAFKRNAAAGDPSFAPIFEDDLRFKTWDETIRPESRAVVLAMMDTSGSMGTIQKYMARSFFYWMIKFLRTTYSAVEIAFIAHHTEAKVVSEEAFFTKGESGGTRCSSAYRKALELIEQKYHPARYNIYPFHFSDGENLTMDNPVCIELIEEIMAVSSMFGYGEVNIHNRYSTLMNAFQAIEDPKFRTFVLKKKSDVYEALKAFFYREEAYV